MIDATEKINTLQFYAIIKERFNDNLHLQKSFVKVENNPFKIYYRQDYPDKGIEILYLKGKNNNKALIKPSGFPWVNLNLNPLNNQLRVKQHHTIFQPGFSYLVSVIRDIMNKNSNNIENLVEYTGKVIWDKTECYKLTITNLDFKYTTYKVKQGETVDDIAEKFYISSYMILEINNNVDSYTDINEEQTIIIPNTYATKMIMFIDIKRKIPLVLKIYDDKGLYELYEFYNVEINKEFKSNEFLPTFSEYGF